MIRYLLCVLIITAVGCKKDEEKAQMAISGTVTDRGDNSALGGAYVKIYYKPYANGVFSNTYSLLTSTTTSSAGTYSFSLEKPTTSDFKFVVEATNYFTVEKIENADNISINDPNTRNFDVYPSCNVTIHIKNTSPIDSADYIQFQTLGMNYSCSSCCNTTPREFHGTSIDTSYSCTRYAKSYLKYQYFRTKAGVTNFVTDSIYCPLGVSTNLNINY